MTAPEGRVPDVELIHRTQQGDTTAFDELMMRYNEAIYRLAYSTVRNHADAEDISQEAFIRAYRAIGRFNEEYRFYTWMHRITVNLCINLLRRRKRMRLVSLPGSERGSEWAEIADPRSDIETGELRRDLDRAMEQLPPEQRVVLALRVKQELSYDEISKVLDIPIGTVMSRLSRARGQLKKLLKDYLPQAS